ncbi:NACHT, LRR and PYD domains-containing protein 3-like [Eucyclogobius newberryi]|uniref:NACHT, LRR and PYD domains-containing protein 3-like n=1 Tax=Eucyclogobius newberryi TaxID=166745 RepID=UPI003B5BD21E
MTPGHNTTRARHPGMTPPGHDTRARHPGTTPGHDTRARHPGTTPGHDTRARHPGTTPGHDTRARHPGTTPGHDTRARHPGMTCTHFLYPIRSVERHLWSFKKQKNLLGLRSETKKRHNESESNRNVSEQTETRQISCSKTQMSMMSDSVKEPPPGGSTDPRSRQSHLSLKSDRSRLEPPVFKEPGPDSEEERAEGPRGDCDLDSVFKRLEEQVLDYVKQQLQRLHRLLASDYPECSESEEEEPSREAVLNITLDFLRRMDQEQLVQRLQNNLCSKVQREVKTRLVQKFSRVCEGIAKEGNSSELKQIFTELYITEGEVTEQHEIRHLETKSRKPASAETAIKCEDMFKLPIREEPMRAQTKGPIRVVLTKGVAGVGKTVLTQKFSLDWAEGRTNQELQLLFLFTFRELNVLRDKRFSLVELLHHFFSPSKALCSFQQLQVLFIFDGLDECRLPLDFIQTRVLSDPTEPISVNVLLVNLIRGSLLPSARLWITTRPAASNQIPAECVSMVTEVRGFADPQKEEYFRKRFRDERQVTLVLSHIKSIRSLHIMCHIPVFCWILSTVIQKLLEQTEEPELPQTLTQMYVHFLVVQAKVKNIKYHQRSGADLPWTKETREMVQSLGKVAFEQLQKGNLIFYESDLSECGLDAVAASVYSGVFTQVFIEEPGLYQDKVYCFIHLSVQEFLAALHVHQTFFSSGENLLSPSDSSKKAFYSSAVNKALQSPNGHLDLFLRLLLGLSLPTNQSLLQGLLTHTGSGSQTIQRLLKGLLPHTGSGSQTNQETVKYLKQKLNDEGLSTERSLNLFYCLNELNDRSLVQDIQNTLREGRLKADELSPAQWSALAFFLLSTDSDLEEFDLRKYCPSEKALLNLLPVIKFYTKAILSGCNLTNSICGPLASVLSSSSLKHLDLSLNDLQDSGVELLCDGLKSAPCRLETLSLSGCNLINSICGPLASVLSSSSLTHLDLSLNDLQDSGVELLCDGLKSAPCRLDTLRLSGCLVSERGGAALASALSPTHSHLRELDLSYNHPGPSAERLTALRDDPHCPLQSVRLDPSGKRWMVPGLRKYYCEFTLDPNTANRRLHLSEDKRTVRLSEPRLVPDHEDRFTHWPQVLASSGLRGRCYWEVECEEDVDVAVSYRGIRRRGGSDECEFGLSDQSWSLRIQGGEYSFIHNKKELKSSLRRAGHTSRVGVFLDSEAGALSFYDVLSDGELSHLHTFSSSFTEPLFPGFSLWWPNTSVSLVEPRTQRPLEDTSL